MSILTKQDRQKVYEFIGKVVFDVMFHQKGCVECCHTFSDLDEYNQFAYQEIYEVVKGGRLEEDNFIETGLADSDEICATIFPMITKIDREPIAEKLFELYCDFRETYA